MIGVFVQKCKPYNYEISIVFWSDWVSLLEGNDAISSMFPDLYHHCMNVLWVIEKSRKCDDIQSPLPLY